VGQVTGGSQGQNSQGASGGWQTGSSSGTTSATTTNAASPDTSNLLNALNSILSGSQNFSQFSQPQVQNLSNTLNAGNTSAINTFKQQAGGTANPNALIQGLTTQGQQSGMQATEGLQSILGGQSLEALLGPLSSISGLLSGNTTSKGSTSGQTGGSYAGNTTGSGSTTSQPSLMSLLFGL
jgi:hypothetical protein